MQRIFDVIEEHILGPLDFELAEILIDALTRIIDSLLIKVEKDNIDLQKISKYERQIFKMLATSFGVFNTHSLFKKESSESNSLLKNTCIELFEKFSKILIIARKEDSGSTEEFSILDKWLPVTFYNISNSAITEWTFQDQNLRVLNGFLNHIEKKNSNAMVDADLIEEEKKLMGDFQKRIELYLFEKDEEVRTRYNRHLHEQSNSKTEEIKAITEEDGEKENSDPSEPKIEDEEIIDTQKKRESAFQLQGQKKATEQLEDNTIQNEIDYNEFLFPNESIYNMATNALIKLLQHSSFDMIKYVISKIPQLIKLSEGQRKLRSANIYRIISVSLALKIKNRDRRTEFTKLILDQLNEIRKDYSVEISLENCHDFYTFLNYLRINYDNYNLETRKESVKLMHHFLKEYVEFLQAHNDKREEILQKNTFLHQNFKDLFELATEAEEEIRFLATDSLRLIIEEFLPPTPIVKGDAYNDDLKKIRGNVSKAFDNNEMIEKIDLY